MSIVEFLEDLKAGGITSGYCLFFPHHTSPFALPIFFVKYKILPEMSNIPSELIVYSGLSICFLIPIKQKLVQWESIM